MGVRGRGDLTLHRCARGLREERDEQEIDEVDEGQGIVPEHASCKDRKKTKKGVKKGSIVINDNTYSVVLYGLFALRNI